MTTTGDSSVGGRQHQGRHQQNWGRYMGRGGGGGMAAACGDLFFLICLEQKAKKVALAFARQ